MSYATWLDTQHYGDDLKFINADFVEFELGPRKILIGQNRGVGKGGHFWDGAYVLAEALVVSPPDALRRNEACSVLELGAGAGLTGIFVGPGARINKGDIDRWRRWRPRFAEEELPPEPSAS